MPKRTQAEIEKDFADFLEQDLQEIMAGKRPLKMPTWLAVGPEKRKAALYAAEASAYAKLREQGKTPLYRQGRRQDDPYYTPPVKVGEERAEAKRILEEAREKSKQMLEEAQEKSKQAASMQKIAKERLENVEKRVADMVKAAEVEAANIRAEAALYRADVNEKLRPEAIKAAAEDKSLELIPIETSRAQIVGKGCTLKWYPKTANSLGLLDKREVSAFLKTLLCHLEQNQNPKVSIMKIIMLRPDGKKVPVLELLLPSGGNEMIDDIGKLCSQIVDVSMAIVTQQMLDSLDGKDAKISYPDRIGACGIMNNAKLRYGTLRVKSGVFIISFAGKYKAESAFYRKRVIATAIIALAQLAAARGELPLPVREIRDLENDEVVEEVNADFDKLRHLEHERWNAWAFVDLPRAWL